MTAQQSFDTLLFEIRDAVATITLNRPDAANALNLQMARDLFDASLLCLDQEVRAVIITATGRMFCAGGDLAEIDGHGDARPGAVTRMATILHAALTRFAYLDAPVVTAINGTAAGAGFSIAISGDFSIAAEGVKMLSAYTASGLSPDGTSTYTLAKHVGLARAKELMLTNRVLTAEEARDWGLINRVVPADALADEAAAMARSFAEGPTRAFGETKRLLMTAFSATLETQIEKETQGIADMTRTVDGPHGVSSFLNKKKPTYQGR
jgi:2-(1,2-epoxy-1,2-dihydrophenyl)acetyl-CoA isomerase